MHDRPFRAAPPAALLLALLCACRAEPGEPPVTAEDLQSQIQALYERALEAGEDVPADAYDWAVQDAQRIGDWEYDVVRLPDDDATLHAKLNELGGERWEAYWVDREGGELRIFLKRPARSYLRMIPLSELGRLVPDGSP
ncbi:MAG: hypothetical protein QNK04_07975 [Myxococcota bacterium]|nr:hypothetical protein [Myxococcota bacterium]